MKEPHEIRGTWEAKLYMFCIALAAFLVVSAPWWFALTAAILAATFAALTGSAFA